MFRDSGLYLEAVPSEQHFSVSRYPLKSCKAVEWPWIQTWHSVQTMCKLLYIIIIIISCHLSWFHSRRFSQILSLDLVAMPVLKFSCAIVILSKAATSAAALVLISRRACDHVRPGKPDRHCSRNPQIRWKTSPQIRAIVHLRGIVPGRIVESGRFLKEKLKPKPMQPMTAHLHTNVIKCHKILKLRLHNHLDGHWAKESSSARQTVSISAWLKP